MAFDRKPPLPKNFKPQGPKHANPEGEIWLYGHHAVNAALKNPKRKILKLSCTRNGWPHIEANVDFARHPEPDIIDRNLLDALLPASAVHQGVMAKAEQLLAPSLQSLIATHGTLGPWVMLDQVTEPQNVGAVLRSMTAFGAPILCQHQFHGAAINGAMAKAAPGGLEHVPIVTVRNVADSLEELKKAGFVIVGLDERGELSIDTAAQKFGKQPTVLVFGAEGKGLRERVRETCDVLAQIPTSGAIQALNISNAAAVTLFCWQQAK